MKPRRFLFAGFCMLIISQLVAAQKPDKRLNAHCNPDQENYSVRSSTAVLGHPVSSRCTSGDSFLTPHFSLTTFKLSSNATYEGYFAKYDMASNEFCLLVNQEIRVLSGDEVKEFYYIDSLTNKQATFVNADRWRNKNGMPGIGFFEILVNGPVSLVKRTEANIGGYTANSFVGGSVKFRIVRKEQVYYLSNATIKTLPVGNKVFSVFGNYSRDVRNFSKVKKLNPNDEAHLCEIFAYFNAKLLSSTLNNDLMSKIR